MKCPRCGRPQPADTVPVQFQSTSDSGSNLTVISRCVKCGVKLEWFWQPAVRLAPVTEGLSVVIAGSRNMPLSDYLLIGQAVERSGWKVREVVCGMATGADQLGGKWAYSHGIPVVKMPAEWEKYGKSAGFIRNQAMAQRADAAIVFVYNKSPGSLHMLRTMSLLRKPTFPVYDGELDYAF